jgi:GH3 auxin-responsive promoter
MSIVEGALHMAATGYLKALAHGMPRSRTQLARNQERNWRALRASLKGTQIYRELRLENIRTHSDYLRHVPVHDYEFFEPYVKRVEQGESNVLFTDHCGSFALTSGTAGYDSKRIPLNQSQLKLFIRAQARLVALGMFLERGAINFLKSDRLTLGSVATLYRKGEHNYGYISGIIGTHMPKGLRKRTFPSERVFSEPDWAQRIRELTKEARCRDIRWISAIPSYIVSVFEHVLMDTGEQEIRNIWPNLRVLMYAGTPINQYASRIEKLVGHPIRCYGFYAATEAPIGLPYGSFCGEPQLYSLNPDLVFSFSRPGSSSVCGIEDVKCNMPYLINISTPNGFIQYSMKDFIEFHAVDGSLVFQFVGREGEAINLAAEKVSHRDLLQAVDELKKQLDTEIHHFFVAPSFDACGIPSYAWTLFVDSRAYLDLKRIADSLDSLLQRLNLDYRDCRVIGVIGAQSVRTADSASLQGYVARNRGNGQFKMKTTFRSAEEFERFMQKIFAG